MSQLPLPGVIARDKAMAQVERKADLTFPEFREQAKAFILRYLAQHGPTPGEHITLACTGAGIKPHDDRAFGPVYMALARAGRIVKVGTKPRTLRGHCAPGCSIWALRR